MDKYVDSLLSFAHSILVEEKRTDKGVGRNLSFIIFKYDDWNGEEQAVPVHLTICKKDCYSWTWLFFHSSDFVIVIAIALSWQIQQLQGDR